MINYFSFVKRFQELWNNIRDTFQQKADENVKEFNAQQKLFSAYI